MCTGSYQHQSFWNEGLFYEVSGFLEYQLHVEVIVLYFLSSFGFIEIWIVVCYIVLIALESETSYTIWRGHSSRKTAVLVVVWCYKARGNSDNDLWRYWPPEGCIKQCHCCIWYLCQALGHAEWKHKIQNIPDSNHWRESSFTQHITLCFVYCFSVLCAFCQAALLLTYDVAMNVRSFLELEPHHIIHILGFMTPQFLPICLMNTAD